VSKPLLGSNRRINRRTNRRTCDRICDNPAMAQMRRSRSPLISIVLIGLAAFVAGCGSNPATASPASPSPSAAASPTDSPLPPTPQPTPAPTLPAAVAIVPVAGFRTTATTIDQAGVTALLAGTNQQFTSLELVTGDADGILGELGLTQSSAGTKLVLAPTIAALSADMASAAGRLGLIRASQVGPSVRALAWGGKSLFGVYRVKSLNDWPLKATLATDTASTTIAFDPTQIWTVAAAGDVMLDRGVYTIIKTKGLGPDYPFDGGTAAITSRYCCSPQPFDWVMPRSKRLTTTPDVRNFLTGADLAMLNLEGPAPVKSSYHGAGMSFTFNQAYLVGLKNAGIDVVSLANNHIGNAGRQGMRETMAALDKLGIAYGGLGSNATTARAPALFTVDGVKVAFMGYDAIAPSYAAGPGLVGTAELSKGSPADDIRAAKAAGAQVVIVYPHWGIEYRTNPTASQKSWAHKMIDAGADIVIGNHPHYAEGMEVYKGKPIWYALGNFVFDQTWSEQTEEGLTLELSFNGPTLVQAWMHPMLDLNSSQPNFLDAASGKYVMDQVYKASKGLLPW
jgi:hypothetical protein